MNLFRSAKTVPQPSGSAAPRLPGWFRREWTSREEGERQLGLANFVEANQYLTQAAEEANQCGVPRKTRARILLSLATAQRGQKKFSEARETAEGSLRLLEEGGSKPTADKARCLDLVGGILLDEGDFAGAQRWLRRAVEVEQKLGKPNLGALSERLRRLAQAQRQGGGLGEALITLNTSLELAEKAFEPESAALTELLAERASVYQEQGQYAEGLADLERAIAIHMKVSGPDSEEVVLGYQRLAGLCKAAGDFEKAVRHYERAIHIRERQLGGSGAELALLMMNLAEIQTGRGRHTAALEWMQHAVMRWESIRGDGLTNALDGLAAVYSRCGRPKEAVACLMRARTAWEKLPGDHAAQLQANYEAIAQIMRTLPEEDAEAITARVISPAYRNPRPVEPSYTDAWVGPMGAQPLVPAALLYDGLQAPNAGNVRLSLVGGNGLPIADHAAVSALGPINLTIVVPDSGRQGKPIETEAIKASPATPSVSARLHGWEDLFFDQITIE